MSGNQDDLIMTDETKVVQLQEKINLKEETWKQRKEVCQSSATVDGMWLLFFLCNKMRESLLGREMNSQSSPHAPSFWNLSIQSTVYRPIF